SLVEKTAVDLGSLRLERNLRATGVPDPHWKCKLYYLSDMDCSTGNKFPNDTHVQTYDRNESTTFPSDGSVHLPHTWDYFDFVSAGDGQKCMAGEIIQQG
ncbi:unnamed protein product, partial [Amoebophrya sp. A25]